MMLLMNLDDTQGTDNDTDNDTDDDTDDDIHES